MLLNRNVIKLNITFFVGKSFYSSTTQRSIECSCTWSMQYVLLSFHIVLKFNQHSWQVPRGSVGRALYRESGPSQDGDPVPGNLPFFCWFFSICFSFCTVPFFPEFVRKSKINMKCPCIHFIYLITLHSYNRDIHRNAPKSERYEIKQQFFWRKLILGPKYSAFHGIFVHVIHAVCTPLAPYCLKIYSPLMASSPQLSG